MSYKNFFLDTILHIFKDLFFAKRSIFRAFLLITLTSNLVLAQEPLVTKKDDVVITKTDSKQDVKLKRIKENGGEVIIDGSLNVLDTVYGTKSFDLVEISTPVTPATNHARIFLRADGTKQTLVIIYDDGTTDNIATNQ